MQSTTSSTIAEPDPGTDLEELARILAGELGAARAEARRERRRMRAMIAVLVVLLVGTLWSLLPSAPFAQSQRSPMLQPPLSPEVRAARRAELIAMLPADRRRELETFEREVDWLSGYMQTWDQGQAGAVVALMLYRMSQSMEKMPSMEQQMRTMSAQMGALPAIVAELSQMNAKMSVITATMDSTMGRAGRMMPWMPFSP